MEPPCLRKAGYNVCDRSLRTRKYHAIRHNLRGKWLTVPSPFTTFTTCLSMGLLNSRLTSVCFSDRWLPCALINMISKHSWCERGGDGGLLSDSAQAFSDVVFSQSKRGNYATLDFVKFFVKISEQTTNFFSMTRVLFGLLIFFAKLCLKVGVAAYTQVRLIHESLR